MNKSTHNLWKSVYDRYQKATQKETEWYHYCQKYGYVKLETFIPKELNYEIF